MSRTYDLADKLIYYVLNYLVKHGPTPIDTLFRTMKKDVKFTDWEKVFYEKSKMPRWERMTISFSLDLSKAEWITKKRKVWEITLAGRKALRELKTPTKLRLEAKRLFDIWNAIPHEVLMKRKAAIKAAKEAAKLAARKRRKRAKS